MTRPVRIYIDKSKAEAMMFALDSIYKRYYALTTKDHRELYDEQRRLNHAATAEYAALGFDADIFNDWELAEAELIL